MQEKFSLVDHPLVQHKLTLMRDKDCPTAHFRQLIREIALLLAYEVTRDLPLAKTQVETPLETMEAPILAGKKLCFISILRAGNGLLEGMLDLIPSARVGYWPLPRPGYAASRRILLQGTRRYQRASGDRSRSDARNRKLPECRGDPTQTGSAGKYQGRLPPGRSRRRSCFWGGAP